MAEYLTTDTELTSIADAIRTKGGTVAPLVYPQGFIDAIMALPGGGSNGYTVTVSLTNPVNSSSFTNGAIYELYSDDMYDTGETLAIISSPVGTTEVTVSNDIYGIQLYLNGPFPAYLGGSNVTCSGGVSQATAWSGIANFAVTGDGTIIVDGYDYNDD